MMGSLPKELPFELVLKILAAPFYGKLVVHRPLTMLSIFSESDALLGISAKFSRKTNTLHLTFENEDVAREFKKLNPMERS